MRQKQKHTLQVLHWYVYLVCGVLLFFFLAPMLISAHDTASVIAGVVAILVFFRWSWSLWARRLINHLGEL